MTGIGDFRLNHKIRLIAVINIASGTKAQFLKPEKVLFRISKLRKLKLDIEFTMKMEAKKMKSGSIVDGILVLMNGLM